MPMINARTIAACALTLFVGMAVGGTATAWFYSEVVIAKIHTSSASIGVTSKLIVLKSIRAGAADSTVPMLENLLDADLFTLGLYRRSSLGPGEQDAVFRASEYRKQNPHKSSEPTVDEAIGRLLTTNK